MNGPFGLVRGLVLGGYPRTQRREITTSDLPIYTPLIKIYYNRKFIEFGGHERTGYVMYGVPLITFEDGTGETVINNQYILAKSPKNKMFEVTVNELEVGMIIKLVDFNRYKPKFAP